MIICTLKNKNLLLTTTLVTALLSSGCSTIKDLRQIPESQQEVETIFSETTPSIWSETTLTAGESSVAWDDLDDQYLHDLINLAFKKNIDLKNSYLILAQATNSFGISKQQRQIQYGADGSASAVKVEDIDTQESYSASSFARYELDLWNTLKARVKNTELSLENLKENVETLKISLAGTVSTLYFELRVQDQILDLRQEQLNILRKQRDLQAVRLKAGAITRLDVDQLDVEIQSQESNVQSLKSSRKQTEQSLAVLLGQPPQTFRIKKSPLNMFPIPRLNPSAPATLIIKRPDVKKAERSITQANLSIHEARTAYLPTINLEVNADSSEDDLSDFLSVSDVTHTLLSSLQQTFFDDGDRKVEKENAKIVVEQELNNYRLVILESLSEIETALINQNENIRQISILNTQIEAQQRATRITKIRYETGSASAFDFIREEQNKLAIKEREILNWQSGLNTTISLLRSLNIHPDE